MKKIKLGISACLLGEKVRYDGQHCHSKLITEELGKHFEYVRVCPEMAIGLGTPRETIRMVQEPEGELTLIAPKSGKNHTASMREFASEDMKRVAKAGFSGYILKKGSPSCGPFRVKIYTEAGMPLRTDAGFYAAELQKTFPWLPVEDEGRLQDARLFENFIQRVFAISRWQEMLEDGLSLKGLFAFHQYHKYRIMAHNQLALKQLGKMLAQADKNNLEELAEKYLKLFCKTMARTPNTLKHSNVLYHLLGYFKKKIDAHDKKQMTRLIEQYRKGLIPLIVPMSNLKNFAEKYDESYLLNQSCFNFPEDLKMLNSL